MANYKQKVIATRMDSLKLFRSLLKVADQKIDKGDPEGAWADLDTAQTILKNTRLSYLQERSLEDRYERSKKKYIGKFGEKTNG